MINIAVFASGEGSNFQAIADACAKGIIDARIAVMVCDRPSAAVNRRAEQMGIECLTFSAKDYASKQEYETLISQRLRQKGVTLICLAGYMRIVGQTLLQDFAGRIINLHPSLLPSFAGAHAIEQAFEHGVKVYGATIHYVDQTLDGGRIIAQRAVEYDGSDIEELTAKIHSIEHSLYIETINKLLKEQTVR